MLGSRHKNPRRKQAVKSQTFLIAIFFSNITPWARKKRKTKQMGLHQAKKFCIAKETIKKVKRQSTDWENMFNNDTSD